MNVKIYNNTENNLLIAWEELWLRSSHSNYFNSPLWYLSAQEGFKYKECKILSVYEKNNLIAVIPLVKIRKYGLTHYVLPGDFVCGLPFLVENLDQNMLNLIIKSLSEIGTVFIDEVTEDFIKYLNDKNHNIDYYYCSKNYFLDLHKDSEGNVLIADKRKILKRIRNLEDKFQLKTMTGEWENALDTVFKIDSFSTKQNKSSNIFSDQNTRSFFKSLAYHYREKFIIDILYFEEKPIAYSLGFIIGNIYYGNQMGISAEFRQYAPGKTLVVKIMEKLGKIGITKMDMGSGENEFKKSFSKEYKNLYKLIISDWKWKRLYLKIINQFKNNIYFILNKNKKIYPAYRNFTRLLKFKINKYAIKIQS